MQKILLFALFLLAPVLSLPAQTQTTASVLFELDKSDLSAEARKTLDALALHLLEAPDYAVNIEAYTDDRGTEDYNLRLANNRADAVQQYLAEKGLILTKTSVRSWGEQNLAYDNVTEENRQKNRRVDVAVTSFYFSDFTSLQHHLSAPAEQVLIIQPDQEQTVTAANGTVVVIPAQSFVFEDGTSPQGPVELIVREAFSSSDFILQNLTTTSDGKVLQTGGMVYIGAEADGKTLTLAKGAALTVALPTSKPDPGMELFYGQKNADNSINWQPVGQKFRQTLQDPRVTLDIDPALGKQIMAIKVPIYPQPLAPNISGEMPPQPRMPSAPYEPRAPQKPEWEKVRYMFGGSFGESMSRKGTKKAQKYYREALAKYHRDSLNYVKLSERYRTNLANYATAKQRYAGDLRNWELEVKSRIGAIMEYEREEYLHNYSLALPKALKYVGKNIQKYEYYSHLESAVRDVTLQQFGLALREKQARYDSDFVPVSDIYYKLIGYKVVTEYAGFKNLFWNVKYSQPDTTYRAISKMLTAIGVKAISDSLISAIKEKRLLTAQTPDQADRALRAYVADVTKLGWINCDKFYNDPAEKVQLAVNEPEDATMYVVCRDINSVLPFNRAGRGIYTAGGLPKGKKVSIVSIKLKDGVPQFALRDVKAGEPGTLKMDYRSVSVRDLREELKKLNI